MTRSVLVALLPKILRSESCRPRDLARLKDEYKLGRTLASPAVVTQLDLATFNGRPALEIEDFGGIPIEQLVGAQSRNDGACSVPCR